MNFTKFTLTHPEILRHTGIFGMTGSGKTAIVNNLVLQLIQQNINILVLDWKHTYRDLLQKTNNLKIYGISDKIPTLKFNPLIPPDNVNRLHYQEHILALLNSTYTAGQGVISILRALINQHVEKHKSTPTFQDLKDAIEKVSYKGRSKEWVQTAIRILNAICYSGLNYVVNNKDPIPAKDLLRSNVVLELGELAATEKTFLIKSLLLYIHYWVQKNNKREILQNVIVIEEAHHVLKSNPNSPNESITDILLKEVREFGVGVIVVDQNPSSLSTPALSNNYTTIGLYTKHASDINALAKAMYLDENDRKYLGRLNVGEGVVRLAGRLYEPFLVKFDHIPLKKGKITDNDIKKHMCIDSANSTSKLPQIKLPPPNSSDSVSDISNHITTNSVLNGFNSKKRALLRSFINSLIDCPFSSVAERNKQCGISTRQGSWCEKTLESLALINIVWIKAGKRSKKLIDLPNTSRRKLDLPILPERLGGLEHRYWVNHISNWYKDRGYNIENEVKVPEGFIDIVASNDKESIAIEVETGKSNIQKSLEKLEQNDFTKRIIVVSENDLKLYISSKLVDVMTTKCYCN